jgi:hypothetical protein
MGTTKIPRRPQVEIDREQYPELRGEAFTLGITLKELQKRINTAYLTNKKKK